MDFVIREMIEFFFAMELGEFMVAEFWWDN